MPSSSVSSGHTAQVQDLFEHGYNNVHFFTVSAVDSVKQIAKKLFYPRPNAKNEVIGQQEVWNRLMEMVRGEPFAPCADVLRARRVAANWRWHWLLPAIFWAIHQCSGNGNIRTSTSPFLPSEHRQYGQRA